MNNTKKGKAVGKQQKGMDLKRKPARGEKRKKKKEKKGKESEEQYNSCLPLAV